MLQQLKYLEGSRPGKKRKVETEIITTEEKESKSDKGKPRKPRSFQKDWLNDYKWLTLENDKMKCKTCVEYYGINPNKVDRTRGTAFLIGTTNYKKSAINDHNISKPHEHAVLMLAARSSTAEEKAASKAAETVNLLKASERGRLANLFRNVHALAKQNRPITDYKWLCDLDKAKGIDIGQTYHNDHAAVDFLKAIAKVEEKKNTKSIKQSPFFSFMLDGTTDISGSEQEAVYLRHSNKGKILDCFLNIGSPKSTTSEELKNHIVDVLTKPNIDMKKMVGMGSDGASNMTGVKGGLATLLRRDVNNEMINTHCMAHRLELAFRDCLKDNKNYDKLMTLLIGVHYLFKKSYKAKSGLQAAIKAVGDGVLPPKVTGTRWLPHLFRGITAMKRTYRALEAYLATASHQSPKAEGLYKLLTNVNLIEFTLFLHDALDHLMRLSLKLQQDDVTLHASLVWVESTVELLKEKKGSLSEDVVKLQQTKKFDGITLKGNPSSMGYVDVILEKLVKAIETRFTTEAKNIQNATKILHFGRWPITQNKDFATFGHTEIKDVTDHFEKTLRYAKPDFDQSTAAKEWAMLKKVILKNHENTLTNLTWETVLGENNCDLPNITLVIDLMLSLPPTSVKCETAFSQLKLLKTCRRSKLSATVLQSLMCAKLLSPSIREFDPTDAINEWMAASSRRPTYSRSSKASTATPVTVLDNDPVIIINDVPERGQTQAAEGSKESVTDSVDTESQEENHEERLFLPVIAGIEIDNLCDCDDDEEIDDCYDHQDEMLNFEKIMEFARD